MEQDLTALFEDAESERDVKLVRKGHPSYDKYTDAQIWAAVEKLRAQDSAAPLTPKDLKLPNGSCFRNRIQRRTARICDCAWGRLR